jgi:transposase
MQNQLFEAALGIAKQWLVRSVDFDAIRKVLTIKVNFVVETKFLARGVPGQHPIRETQTKGLRVSRLLPERMLS